ncbi:MAG: GNAT family N-acetyltransferase [Anaerolineae bacterium]
MVDDLPLRDATPADIPALVSHRRRMFEDMASARGTAQDPAGLYAMDAAYALHLHAHLGDDTLRAWVIEAAGRIVASGAVSFLVWPPRPNDLTERLALLHSVYTAPEYRRRGLARRIVQTAIEVCRVEGLRRLTLHASEAGRLLYESLGFEPTNEMRLVLRYDDAGKNPTL